MGLWSMYSNHWAVKAELRKNMQPLKLAAVPENPSVANLKWTIPKMVVYGYGTGFTDSCSPGHLPS